MNARHGVSTIQSGVRYAMGVIFDDAAQARFASFSGGRLDLIMVVVRTFAVVAFASGALVIGTPLATEIVAWSQVVVRVVEAFARRLGGRRLRVAEVRMTIVIRRIRESHNRDREQPRHDDLTHR